MSSLDALRSGLLGDTEREMDRILSLPEHQARREMMLLALEREQVAAIAYSEDLIADRIASLPISPELQAVIRRAVLWVHRDEALHAQFLRGALLRTRGGSLAVPPLVTLARQAVGAVGGWVSAVGYHNEEAVGLRRLAAIGALRIGHLAGRVPSVLLDELQYSGFKRYCGLSVVLEETAVIGYERMRPLVGSELTADFDQMLADERRHAALFQVLHDSFDENDRLVCGVDDQMMLDRITGVSEWFAPAARRAPLHHSSALGSGSLVHVARGDAVVSTLERACERGGLPPLVTPGARVAVRVPFMMGYDRRDQTSMVRPELLEGLARKLRDWGASDVAAIESPTVYDRYFANRSVAAVAEHFGFVSDSYRVVDAEADRRPVEYARGMSAATLSATWLDADLRIVVSKLRSDPSEIAHLSLPTMAGIGGRHDGQVHTDRLVDHWTAVLMALDVAPPDFAVVDAWGPLADGPVGVMGCHRPSVQNRVYAGADALAVDIAVLRDLGIHDPLASESLKRAEQWLGALPEDFEVAGEPGPFEDFRVPQRSAWYRFVSATAAPVYFHLSGHGRLFVPRMDEAAFPPIDDPGVFVRGVRRLSQQVFGLHPGD